MMRHLTTVLSLVAFLACIGIAKATPPVFTGNVITATIPMYNEKYYSSFQAAITAGEAGGGCVFVPAGTYNLGSTQLTGNRTLCIIGSGPGQVYIQGSANPILAVSYSSSDDTASPIIKDVAFVTTSSNGALSVTDTAASFNTQPVRIENVLFDTSSQVTASTALTMTGVNSAQIVASHFVGRSTVSGSHAISLVGTSEVVISAGTLIQHFDTAIITAKNGATDNSNLTVSGDVMYANNTDVDIIGSNEDIISDNAENNCGNICIIDNSLGGDQIIGNTIYDTLAASSGLPAITANGTNLLIEGNNITQNSAGNICIRFGDDVNNKSAFVSVIGNGCTALTTFANVFVVGQYAQTGNLITGNTINTTAACTSACLSYNATLITNSFGYAPALTVRDNVGGSDATFSGAGSINPTGSVSCPTLATATWEWNPTPFSITEFVSGGTVTSIQTAGPSNTGSAGTAVVTGLTSGPVMLDPGMAINITYSVAPTVACIAR